jgi:hypothetical protein
MQRNGRPELMHRLALQTDEDGKGVAVLFEIPMRLAWTPVRRPVKRYSRSFIKTVLVAAEGEMDHAGAMLADHGFF